MTSAHAQESAQAAVRRTVALVLAGGRGSRLKHLTDWRAKPAVPFAGKFRIVDFALSNCLNSGIRRIGVVTQYKAHALIHHLQKGWGFLRAELNEFVELLPAQQQIHEDVWYRGTADAVFQNLEILRSHQPEYVLILAGDHVYKQDYSRMLADHIQTGADVTVACIDVPRMQATGFGVIHVDGDNRITSFVEKPADPPAIPGQPDRALASMGIYLFRADFLYDQLQRDAATESSSHDFGKDILPYLISHADANIRAHWFRDSCVGDDDKEPYWRDAGTVDSFWESNLDLTRVTPDLNLYDKNWPIWTYQEQLPSAKFVFDNDERRGMAVDSLVSGGCIISGATVRRSLLFSNVRVNSYSLVEDTVILPNVDVGRHVTLKKCIVDDGCRIPPGLTVGEDPEADARRFYRSEGGVTLITRDMLAALEDQPEALAANEAD